MGPSAAFKQSAGALIAAPATVGTLFVVDSLNYVAPDAGIVRIIGNGYCNVQMTAGTAKEFDLAATSNESTSLGGSVAHWGVIVPEPNAAGRVAVNFVADAIYSVDAGSNTAYLLAQEATLGNSTNDSCAGHITVEWEASSL